VPGTDDDVRRDVGEWERHAGVQPNALSAAPTDEEMPKRPL
jgi:hypothetical protein